jgi:hypothetical protein
VRLKLWVDAQEQKLDKWGKQRLTELLAPKKASSEEIGMWPLGIHSQHFLAHRPDRPVQKNCICTSQRITKKGSLADSG